MSTVTYDPADDSKRSYDVAVDALRAKFVEDVTALREQAIERIEFANAGELRSKLSRAA